MKNFLNKIFIIMVLVIILTSTALAKNPYEDNVIRPVNGWYSENGHFYHYKNGEVETGYFKVGKYTYYGHKTASEKYPYGSVTTGQMRIEGKNTWYAFDPYGCRYEKNKYVTKGAHRKIPQLIVNKKSHTVLYVYKTATTQRGWRYSTKLRRWQTIEDDGWHDVGMQVIPEGWVDFQK